MTNDVTYLGCMYEDVPVTGLIGDHEQGDMVCPVGKMVCLTTGDMVCPVGGTV